MYQGALLKDAGGSVTRVDFQATDFARPIMSVREQTDRRKRGVWTHLQPDYAGPDTLQ